MWQEVAEVVMRSLFISGTATVLATSWSIPIAMIITAKESEFRRALLDVANALVAIPTVIIGLVLYLLFSRSGPLGFFGILYTPIAIAIGQAVLITPLIISLSASVLRETRSGIWEMAVSIGATERQALVTMVAESFPKLLTTILLGFNRAIGELGVALMLGGNIKGFTRVMTTVIALEVSKGEFEFALTLAGILLLVTFAVTAIVRKVSKTA
ncbi:MAG: ABC transporter permease [Thaumarchaeota archaeon]|jgi:tungstate transport system permease protein|nr:ABC transporter permease [Candidatus Terraquivivens yellowstonensis]MCL7392865.1 ABC transporter permease [Candidatus Terraquivivens yellowstonensis]MCL7397764.1 ABC transporter permease [Candidatus Terraquivivens yellowstonensis]MCL7399198.1 ABC transporter permease [Candidatus Terraquivivens yellowstonensis]MCL7399970.1 ABC transporter permease [Candidatus Terraquivivens yellowstonensis]